MAENKRITQDGMPKGLMPKAPTGSYQEKGLPAGSMPKAPAPAPTPSNNSPTKSNK